MLRKIAGVLLGMALLMALVILCYALWKIKMIFMEYKLIVGLIMIVLFGFAALLAYFLDW